MTCLDFGLSVIITSLYFLLSLVVEDTVETARVQDAKQNMGCYSERLQETSCFFFLFFLFPNTTQMTQQKWTLNSRWFTCVYVENHL